VWSEDKLGKKFVYLKLLFLLVACVALRFKQSDCGDKAAKPRGFGFGASFCSFAAFSARSDCLNRRATQAIFWRSSLFTYIIRERWMSFFSQVNVCRKTTKTVANCLLQNMYISINGFTHGKQFSLLL